jgi:dethiobiotin synthetase
VACRIVLVTGTGTGIGKTHFAEALLLALGKLGLKAVGIKPVETGLSEGGVSDAERLSAASSFHVKHVGLRFGEPVSPHLAAREAGVPVVLNEIAAEVHRAVAPADVAVVELAGGLFTPLTDRETNADLAARLKPDLALLVAPDRLGVLHDTIAATRAAAAMGVVIDGVVLVAQEGPDASSGRNASEIGRVHSTPCLGVLPRATAAALAGETPVATIASLCHGLPLHPS